MLWMIPLACTGDPAPVDTQETTPDTDETVPDTTEPVDTAPPDTADTKGKDTASKKDTAVKDTGEEEPPPPRVLLIIADDFGVDVLPAYADHPLAEEPTRDRLPLATMDSICTDGVRFDAAWANPTCTPTRGTILTGEYGFRTGLAGTGEASNLTASQRTLPQYLSANIIGFQGGSVGKWHLGDDDDLGGLLTPNRFGWDHYSGALDNIDDYYAWPHVINGHESTSTTYATTAQIDAAIAWWTAQPDDAPRLLWFAPNAPHGPFHFPPDGLHTQDTTSKDEAIQYDAMVEALDVELARLLAVVDEHTLVILIGDNGTPPRAVRGPYASNRAKGALYQGGITVPLCARGPGVGTGSHGGMVQSVDLFPTIAEYMGAALPEDLDGVSLLPLLEDPTLDPVRALAYTEQDRSHVEDASPAGGVAVRDDRYKWIRFHDGTERLYDLDKDPLESSTLHNDDAYEKTRAAMEALYDSIAK